MGVMTPARDEGHNRHDTLPAMTGKGTTRQTVRIDALLWQRFGNSAEKADRDRSALLREFVRWYVGDVDELPERPRRRR